MMSDIDQDEERKQPQSFLAPALSTVVFCCISLATVITNCLVLAAVVVRPGLTRTRSNLYIITLACSDLVVGALVMPLNIDFVLNEYKWHRGWLLCGLWLFTDTLMCTCSVWNVTAIAVDRLMAISRPIMYMKMTRFNTLMAIVCFMSISMAICLPPLLIRDTIHLEMCVYTSATWYLVHSALGAFFVPFVTIVVCYTIIFYKLWSKMKRRRDLAITIPMSNLRQSNSHLLTNRSSPHPFSSAFRSSQDVPLTPMRLSSLTMTRSMTSRSSLLRERRVLIQMSVLVLIFLLCWMPFWALFITLPICLHYEWCSYTSEVHFWGLLFQWLGYTNSLLNPFLYTLLNKEFRAAIVHLIKKLLNCR